jgi:hypothetical protein
VSFAVFYVRGAGLEQRDLVRAGVYKASRIAILSENDKNSVQHNVSKAEDIAAGIY